MRILQLDDQPIHEIMYLRAASGGGTEIGQLPILTGHVDRLPDGLEALLLTSDLQGVAPFAEAGGASTLLGEVLAAELEQLADDGVVPPPGVVGVILAGDLYSEPSGDKRGASGDVRVVWAAFARSFRWVAGVAGNHDQFGTEREARRFGEQPNVDILDGDVVDLDGLRIGGVSWIPGKPSKPGRVALDDFLAHLDTVVAARADLIVLHEGPTGDRHQRGNSEVRQRVVAAQVPLTVCGHVHWSAPLAEIGTGQQVLNVDARAVLLTRRGDEASP